jgi:protein TonB
MTAALLGSPLIEAPGRPGDWPRRLAAAGVAVGVHAAVLALLLTGWQGEPPPVPQVRTLTTRLVALAPPAPPASPQLEEAPPPAPVEPARPVEAPRPDSRLERQKLEQAALARKRVEEQKRKQLREQERREAEALVQRQERQRLAEAAERARAEAAASAAAERARAEAAAAERARAEAASSQYLPIAKQAPDYPESALDRGIEGDCTVGYRVNPEGRVEEPRIVGDCHPLFIRPSLAAARTFRYRPRIVDGQAVAVPDVKNTFHYRIQEKDR